jgi:hypothetical protein
MTPLQMVTSVTVNPSIPRANVTVLNRGKPLEQRPVVNYSPVEATVEFIKNGTSIESCLGLLNGSNVTTNLVDTKPATAVYGVRSMQVAFAPTSSAAYNGLLDIKSGVLTSYGLQGGVSEPIKGSFSMQCLDMSGSYFNATRDTTNYAAAIIRPQDQLLTGLYSASEISLTGFGLTGITVQSFSFNLGFGRSAVMQLGQKYPIERPLTDVNASLQCQGFFEGINNSMTGLIMYDCGAPAYGVVGLTMTPSCSNGSSTTVTMKNPYFDGMSINGQAGGFSTFSISFSLPIGPNPAETTDGSVVTIV